MLAEEVNNLLNEKIDLQPYITVSGYSGVAFWIDDWARELKDEFFIDDFYSDGDEPSWGWNEVEVISDSMVECYMVGDDRKFVVDIADISVIDSDSFCRSCGQIGCTHG